MFRNKTDGKHYVTAHYGYPEGNTTFWDYQQEELKIMCPDGLSKLKLIN